MIEGSPLPDTFNARWVSPESVAETFVPIPQFRQLTHNSHSLLLGPRGCGKTTLLKMLTRPAQEKWQALGRTSKFDVKFNSPGFEAVYIPSDVRWSYELNAMPDAICSKSDLVNRTQRVMVAFNAIFHLMGTIRPLVGDDRPLERKICEQLIRRLKLINTVPTIRDTRCSLEEISATLRGSIASSDAKKLETELERMPGFLFGHALDPVSTTLRFVSEQLKANIRPQTWALCYDELEIAPAWLRQELIAGLRSGPQDVLLKLTWYPILPSGIQTAPGAADDFRPIRLWHSHIEDPKGFCEDLTREFLQRKFGVKSPSPAEFFSRSVLAAEKADEEPAKAYERDSTEYTAFKDLAQWDRSFENLLRKRGIDPLDPVPKNQAEKDQFFRKVKPIVLLRNTFSDELRRRSRKAPALYVGREAVYAISEGNPRWLLSLLNDLIDLGEPNPGELNSVNVGYTSQGRILTSASIRFRALIKSNPFKPPECIIHADNHTLLGFIELIGTYFRESLHDRREFHEDPIGSFEFPKENDELYSSIVTQLLEIGALVYVGSSQQDVPNSIRGSRFRLSFMLAPIFRLPFRNFQSISLREILSRKVDKYQYELPI